MARKQTNPKAKCAGCNTPFDDPDEMSAILPGVCAPCAFRAIAFSIDASSSFDRLTLWYKVLYRDKET